MTTHKRVSFYAEPEIEAILKRWSEWSGASIGEGVRRAIRFTEQQLLKHPEIFNESPAPSPWPVPGRAPQPVLFAPKQETR